MDPADIDWDEAIEPPLGHGSKPASWSHADWPETAA
jgi:hypothetical protein